MSKSTRMSFLLAVSVQLCSAAPLVVQNLSICLHGTASLTPVEAQAAMNVAGDVLQKSDFAGDIACPVSFKLSGKIAGSNDHSQKRIKSDDDFRKTCSQPGYAHVVDAIDYCGVDAPALGCSRANPPCMVVVRAYSDDFPDDEGILWAHEYGHTKGLQHRDPDDETAVMNRYIGLTERGINQTECNAFLKQAASTTTQSSASSAAHPAVRDFVHRRYFEGVPYEIASTYSHEDAETLLALLENPEEKRFLPNIVAVLGMIGDPVAIRPLQAFIESGAGTLDPPVANAKMFAPTALGYIANRSRNTEVVTYLQKGMFPEGWTPRVHWNLLGAENVRQRNLALAESSIKGLGLSGLPEAEKALKSVGFALPPEEGAVIQPAIKHALELNKQIQQMGLKQYYQQNRIR